MHKKVAMPGRREHARGRNRPIHLPGSRLDQVDIAGLIEAAVTGIILLSNSAEKTGRGPILIVRQNYRQEPLMLITKNPSDEKIQWLIEQSTQKYAFWIKDGEDGDLYYWPAGYTSPHEMAYKLQIGKFETGVVT